MNDELRALIEAAKHGGDVERLVLADWLEEHGDEHEQDWGWVIRLEVDVKPHAGGDPWRQAVRDELARLEYRHAEAWYGWARTIPGRVQVTRAEWLFAVRLHPEFPPTEVLAALAQRPEWPWVGTLDLRGYGLGDARVAGLAASPHLAHLLTLDLSDNLVRDEGVAALAASPHLSRLTTLDLSRNPIWYEQARALTTSPRLPHLTTLHLEGTYRDDDY